MRCWAVLLQERLAKPQETPWGMFTAAWRSLPSGLLEETVNFSGESLRTRALREDPGGAGIGCL